MARVSRNINDAHARLQEVWFYLQLNWTIKYPDGPQMILAETYRPTAVQRAYYAQGRESLQRVNALRKEVGLAALKERENRIITRMIPGKSKHNIKPSLAMDIMLYENGKPVNDLAWYRKMADMAQEKDARVRWGGDWDMDGRSDDERLIDGPHLELI